MKYIIILLIFLLIPLALADTTFFDSDDGFIMSSSSTTSPTGGVIITEEQQASSGGGCLYKWNCTNWSICFPSGKQTRNCTNIGTCSNTYKSPETEQNCTYTASENETEEIPFSPLDKKSIDNKIFFYFVIVLIILSIIFYLKKDYFKKLIKKIRK